jgi:hypothetical protein
VTVTGWIVVLVQNANASWMMFPAVEMRLCSCTVVLLAPRLAEVTDAAIAGCDNKRPADSPDENLNLILVSV